MRMAHKEDEKVFRLAELRFASAFNVVDDQTGGVLGTTVAVMENDPDSWYACLTQDDGASFRPVVWQFREFPFPPTLVQSVNDTTLETNGARIEALRVALRKWHELVCAD
jgi:hypothetical protein